MKAFRELRESFKERHVTSGFHVNTHQGQAKHIASMEPPKYVIRANADYISQHQHELGFHKGDFFHVLESNRPLPHGWIEACNPVTNARGIVPADYFDIISRTKPRAAFCLSVQSELNPNGVPETPQLSRSSGSNSSSSTRTSSGTIATFKYDFKAELPHELSARAGESVLVVARSSDEWLVAKPLDHLGAAGLIPTSFVSFRDKVSGEPILSEENECILTHIPSVVEWEEKNRRLRETAIPLGTINQNYSKTQLQPPAISSHAFPRIGSVPASADMGTDDYFSHLLQQASTSFSAPTHSLARSDHNVSQQSLPPGILISASVLDVRPDVSDYWYRVRAIHISDILKGPDPSKASLYEHRELILQRRYKDFVQLHDSIESELLHLVSPSSSCDTPSKALSNLPVPPQEPYYTAQQCCKDLNTYVHHLCSLPESILRSSSLHNMLELRPGDQCRVTILSKIQSPHLSSSDLDHSAQSLGPKNRNKREQLASTFSSLQTKKAPSDSYCAIEEPTMYRIKVARLEKEDQMIALRIPINMSRNSLLLKIQERLGHDINILGVNEPKGRLLLNSDDDLRRWLETYSAKNNKLLLFADSS